MTLLLALGLMLGADPLNAAAQRELKTLQGKWIIVRGEKNGKSQDFPQDGDFVLVVEIKDDKWILSSDKNGRDAHDKSRIVMLDGSTTPKCMDTKSVEKGVEGTIIESIYKLEGDTLTICSNQKTYVEPKERRRPTEFKSTDEFTIVVELKRLKE